MPELPEPANRPSHENAAQYLERAFDLCAQAGFQSIYARGDTDFSQTAYLDRWDARQNVKFLFGMDATATLRLKAQLLPKSQWTTLVRPPRYEVAGKPRTRAKNIKDKIIRQRLFKNLCLAREDVAEMEYQPLKCSKSYRLIICRKLINVEMGQDKLWDEYRYFFFITNDRDASAQELVLKANGRCNQENLIEQLKNGVKAMALPVDNLLSNWAYMVMASLAWSLKAWWGLLLPEKQGQGRARRRQHKSEVVTMEFKRFMASVIRLPCQIVRGGRRLVYRMLSYSPWQEPLLAGVAAWRVRAQC